MRPITRKEFDKIQFDNSSVESQRIGRQVLDIIVQNHIYTGFYNNNITETLNKLLFDIPNEIRQSTDIFQKILWPKKEMIEDPTTGKLDTNKHPLIMICSENNMNDKNPNATEYYGFRLTSHPPKITGTELDILFYSQITSKEVDYTNKIKTKEASYIHCDNISKIILENPCINNVCDIDGELKKDSSIKILIQKKDNVIEQEISVPIKDYFYKRLLTDDITKHVFLQEHHMALKDDKVEIILLELELFKEDIINSALYSRLEEIAMKYPKQVKKIQDDIRKQENKMKNNPEEREIRIISTSL